MHPNIVFRGSTATIWSWSTGCVRGGSWKTRQCIAVLATPQVTANTREAICKLLAWDFRQLNLGVWDVVDSSGKFHPTDSKRERNAGHDMPLKAIPGPSDIGKTCVGFVLKFFCGLNLFLTSRLGHGNCSSKAFCYWKGDMEAHYFAHCLTRYCRCNQCCDFCCGSTAKNNAVLSIGHLTLKAPWRSTISTRTQADPSHWSVVLGFAKNRRLFDLLHLVHLGTLRDIIPSRFIDSLDDGTLAAFYGMQGCSDDMILYRMSQHAHVWAREQNLDVYVGTLTMHRLGRKQNQSRTWPYPELDSRIKAARCRTLFAFVTWLMCRLAMYPLSPEQMLNARVRAVCCWALDVALSVFNRNKRVKMQQHVVKETTWLCRLHSACYQWLGARCLAQRRLLYKVRQKTHYYSHMVDHHEETELCLLHLSTFGDEDFMGKIRKIAAACHGKTYMHAWAKRYALKRALQWSEMRKSVHVRGTFAV